MGTDDGNALIRRAEALYDSLGIDALERHGIIREHARHYGMVVYPSIRSSRPITAAPIFGAPIDGTARLYVHIPFCSGRCTFCHFQLASKARYGQAYLEHLHEEIRLVNAARHGITFHGLFIGGGTPSQLDGDELDLLLRQVQSSLGVERAGFNTIEVHPELVREPDALTRLQQMRGAGLNRISIGVQAFEQRLLDRLSRRHTVEDGYALIELARKAGFEYIDVDLMYGLPEQTLSDWAHTLGEVTALDVDSISIFYLIWRDRTPMGRRPLTERAALPSRRASTVMRIMAREAFTDAGFVQSLTDHFHRSYPERACRPQGSTLLYSNFFVVPVGISGWGYANRHHYWNTFDIEEYSRLIDRGELPITRGLHLDDDERTRRDMMFCLKYGGLPFTPFRERDGVDIREQYRYVLEPLADLGLIRAADDGVVLTSTGSLFMEEVCSFFFSDAVWRDVCGDGGKPPASLVPPSDFEATSLDEGQILETFHYLITPRRAAPERVLAVVAHPDPASFTHALFRAFRAGAELGGRVVHALDLYADGYHAALSREELRASVPPEPVLEHQRLIADADVLAFFHPIWWYAAPALLRAWYERTFTRGFAFDFSPEERYRGLLGAKRVVVVSTGADSGERFDTLWGSAYLQSQIHSTFETVGITQRCVRVFLNVEHAPPAEHARMIAEASFLGRHLDLAPLFAPALASFSNSPYRRGRLEPNADLDVAR